MHEVPTCYFALVRRGDDGRYVAHVPDFPALHAEAGRLDALVGTLRREIRAALAARAPADAPPLTGLPAREAPEDGVWLQVDIAAP